jgi:hypothetical protein
MLIVISGCLRATPPARHMAVMMVVVPVRAEHRQKEIAHGETRTQTGDAGVMR